MFVIRRTIEEDGYIWEDSDPSETSDNDDYSPHYWPVLSDSPLTLRPASPMLPPQPDYMPTPASTCVAANHYPDAAEPPSPDDVYGSTDRRLDPVYALIPPELRGFPRFSETDLTRTQYLEALAAHELQVIEDQEELYGAEMGQSHLFNEELQYQRYRRRGGELRFRPSDIGTEARYEDIPLAADAPEGCYVFDYERLSPTIELLQDRNYRDHIRPWFHSLDPPPTTHTELQDAWYRRSRARLGIETPTTTPPSSPVITTSNIPPPTPPRPSPRTPDHDEQTSPSKRTRQEREATESAAKRRGNDETPTAPSLPIHRATQVLPIDTLDTYVPPISRSSQTAPTAPSTSQSSQTDIIHRVCRTTQAHRPTTRTTFTQCIPSYLYNNRFAPLSDAYVAPSQAPTQRRPQPLHSTSSSSPSRPPQSISQDSTFGALVPQSSASTAHSSVIAPADSTTAFSAGDPDNSGTSGLTKQPR